MKKLNIAFLLCGLLILPSMGVAINNIPHPGGCTISQYTITLSDESDVDKIVFRLKFKKPSVYYYDVYIVLDNSSRSFYACNKLERVWVGTYRTYNNVDKPTFYKDKNTEMKRSRIIRVTGSSTNNLNMYIY